MAKTYDPGISDITKQGIDALLQSVPYISSLSTPKQVLSPLPANLTLNTKETMGLMQDAMRQLYNYGKTGSRAVSEALGQLTSTSPESQIKAQADTIIPDPTPTPFGKKILDGYVMSTPHQYTPIIDQAAQENDIPTSYLSAVLARESERFNPDVISGKINSPAGAEGIAQFMPDTAKGMGINPLDPKQAIMGAAKLLRTHYDQFGSRPDLALAAYNAGPGAVTQYKGIPPYQETQDYVKGIMKDAQTTYGGN